MHCPNPLPSPYNNMFTIHGLWPQDANDDEIDPYSSNPNCAGGVIPTPPQDLPTYLESTPIYPLLDVQWPDLNNPNNNASNYIFWEDEWSKHGQCSDYPANPYNYFDSAVRLRHTLTPDFGFKSGQRWKLDQIISKISDQIKYMPEIACNKNPKTGNLQLWEIRLCFKRPKDMQNCPNPTGKPGTLCYNKYQSPIFVL
ncbi:ribonuclease 1-like [Hibiscus syriacus]|uniref:ribonuclease 1-like n=1 Tax=Hibiscus syriacus TaxID=106335 RepID=UPI001924E4E5|nr:ribonuclease 1-like [Hibiscus syriacus]